MGALGRYRSDRGRALGCAQEGNEAPTPGERVGIVQERTFDLGLGGWVKYGQVKMGKRGNILESEVWLPSVPAGKGFS